jgi:hypothetical protein
VGAVLCSQVLLYELLILALVVPWVRDLFASGHRLLAWLAIGLISLVLIPWMTLEKMGLPIPPSLVVMLLAGLALAGPNSEKSLKRLQPT